jgi:hypothetical protein
VFFFIHTNLSIQLLIDTEHDAKNGDRKLNQPVETVASLYKMECDEQMSAFVIHSQV